MKKFILLIVVLFTTLSIFAQQRNLKQFVIQFNDKGISADVPVNPATFLSEKAVGRRLIHNIAFDEKDIPVNEKYVRDVAATGARVLTRSRWFNTIVVEAEQSIADQLSRLSYVSTVKLLDNKINTNSQSSLKPYFAAEKIGPLTGPVTKQATTDFYNYGSAYNQINQLHGQYLHNNGFRGQGMTIAVIDAGFNSADVMPCFDSLRLHNQIRGTHDFAVQGNNVYATTMSSHGSSVLSCMGANVSGQMIGTAPKADFWLLRSEVVETETVIEEYYWVSAAEFADSVGVDLINSSLGYTAFDPPGPSHTYSDMDGNTTVVTIGADMAAQKGILVVNSAGNDGGGGWMYIGAPADGDSVFTIGAVDVYGIRASFSSVGPTYDRRIKPTVAARGVNATIYYPGGLGGSNGTSFSSPIMCGITACLWQAFPQLNNMQIIEKIKISASQAQNPDSLLGWGIPNFQTAFTSLSFQERINKSIDVFPNPVSDWFTVKVPAGLNGKLNLEIIDVQGKVVYSAVENDFRVKTLKIDDIGFLQPGFYLLRITDGLQSFTSRIIKS